MVTPELVAGFPAEGAIFPNTASLPRNYAGAVIRDEASLKPQSGASCQLSESVSFWAAQTVSLSFVVASRRGAQGRFATMHVTICAKHAPLKPYVRR